MNNEQRFIPAVLVGSVVALLCAVLWAVVTAVTGFQIGYMALGIGFAVGFSMLYVGNGRNSTFGIVGGFLAFLSCFFGNAFSIAVVVANDPEMGQAISTIDVLFVFVTQPAIFIEVMKETFHPMDVVFYIIAIYTGYKCAFHNVSDSVNVSDNGGDVDDSNDNDSDDGDDGEQDTRPLE